MIENICRINIFRLLFLWKLPRYQGQLGFPIPHRARGLLPERLSRYVRWIRNNDIKLWLVNCFDAMLIENTSQIGGTVEDIDNLEANIRVGGLIHVPQLEIVLPIFFS